MKNALVVFLWCVVFVIGFVVLTKLDKWAQDEEAKHQPVFRYNSYVTHS